MWITCCNLHNIEFYQNVIKIVTAPTVVITIIENEESNEGITDNCTTDTGDIWYIWYSYMYCGNIFIIEWIYIYLVRNYYSR